MRISVYSAISSSRFSSRAGLSPQLCTGSIGSMRSEFDSRLTMKSHLFASVLLDSMKPPSSSRNRAISTERIDQTDDFAGDHKSDQPRHVQQPEANHDCHRE